MATEYTEEQLYNMSDEELEALVKSEEESEVIPEETPVEEEITETEEEIVEEETEEVEDEDLEEPESQESDEDEDTLDGGDEENESTEEESEDEEPTEESDENEEDNSDEEDESEKTEESQEPATYRIKADGNEMDLTLEELKILASKGANFTRKTAEIKPWRKTISALAENKISHEDVNLFIAAKNGDKGALKELMGIVEVDPLELDSEDVKYEPKDFGKSDTELTIEETFTKLSRDPNFVTTQNVLTKMWDEQSRTTLIEKLDDPSWQGPNGENPIELLNTQVADGTFDAVNPRAMKLKLLDGGRKSDLDYYIQAGIEYQESVNQQSAKEAEAKKAEAKVKEQKNQEVQKAKKVIKRVNDSKTKSAKRKKAVPSGRNSRPASGVIDYLNDDEAYETWKKNIEEQGY